MNAPPFKAFLPFCLLLAPPPPSFLSGGFFWGLICFWASGSGQNIPFRGLLSKSRVATPRVQFECVPRKGSHLLAAFHLPRLEASPKRQAGFGVGPGSEAARLESPWVNAKVRGARPGLDQTTGCRGPKAFSLSEDRCQRRHLWRMRPEAAHSQLRGAFAIGRVRHSGPFNEPRERQTRRCGVAVA